MSKHASPYSPTYNSPLECMGIEIKLNQAGKKFNRDWIFRNLSYTFTTGISYAIIGANGSGKSTLLQVIASSTNVSEGNIEYKINQSKLPPSTIEQKETIISTEDIYNHISIAAPYLEIIEEMTAIEFLQFHAAFKPLTISINEIINIIGLEKAANKQIRYYSSGMKQRVKLAQAIFTNAPILLLDEPCTNLDKSGYQLYHQLIQNYCSNKLVIVSSNDENEINFCKEKLNMIDYK